MKKILKLLVSTLVISMLLVGCTSKKDNGNSNAEQKKEGLKEGQTLQNIVDKINEDMGIAMGKDIDESMLTDLYGIKTEDIKQYAGKMSMTMTTSDAFLIVEANDGKVEDIKKALEDRRESVIAGQYLPAEKEKANASKIYVNGNYVAFMVLGDTMEENFDSAFAESEATRAEDIVKSFFN